MSKESGIRLVVTAALGGLCSYFQVLVIPLAVLIGAMVVDYITGMSKAWIQNQLSSRTGMVGIIKKIGYLLIVACAMGLDYLILSSLGNVGIHLPENLTIALLVIIWLIINELISILENLAIVGVPMPGWLTKLVHRLKVIAEAKGEEMVKEEEEHEAENH